MLCTTPLAALLFTAALASSLPAAQKRTTWTPPVLYPHAGTVWLSGQHHNVTWSAPPPPSYSYSFAHRDASDPPANITDRPLLYLRSQIAQWPGAPLPALRGECGG